MTRKLTITCELPEEIVRVLEDRAVEEGRPFNELVADYMACHRTPTRAIAPAEQASRVAMFERCFGSLRSGNPHSAGSDRIDADLAREYGRG
ncbi:MAG: hypothetical protein ACHRHE_14940 [Tepidisphaerales bacterium]